MKDKQILLVSGLSGAGKSSACKILEDMGYHIIDNYPAELIDELITLLKTTEKKKFEQVVISTPAYDFKTFLDSFRKAGFKVQVLYLEANEATLITRYKFTRRSHPLLLNHYADSLEDAIRKEEEIFKEALDEHVIRLDTTYLTVKEMANKIEEYFNEDEIPSFSITFMSFGFKYGVPMDADLMLDVRFLPNPYWDQSLRVHNGNEDCVYNYVMEKEETKVFIEKLLAFTDYAFEEYRKEGKNHFTLAIGCTGGQHRSVTITNFLYDYYRKSYHCFKNHRDEKEWITECK